MKKIRCRQQTAIGHQDLQCENITNVLQYGTIWSADLVQVSSMWMVHIICTMGSLHSFTVWEQFHCKLWYWLEFHLCRQKPTCPPISVKVFLAHTLFWPHSPVHSCFLSSSYIFSNLSKQTALNSTSVNEAVCSPSSTTDIVEVAVFNLSGCRLILSDTQESADFSPESYS